MIIVLLGAPACGKGTQGKMLSTKYNIPTISTGELFRKNLSEKTEIGRIAEEYMSKGQNVPDDCTLKMLYNRLDNNDCNNGFILDGFPRTVGQAVEFDKKYPVDKAIYLEVDYETLKSRTLLRKVCEKCGQTFATTDKTCACGGNLIVREDDNEQRLTKRLATFEKDTKPLIDYYKNKLIVIDGTKSVDEIHRQIVNGLEA